MKLCSPKAARQKQKSPATGGDWSGWRELKFGFLYGR
jgi:hypothetical protein